MGNQINDSRLCGSIKPFFYLGLFVMCYWLVGIVGLSIVIWILLHWPLRFVFWGSIIQSSHEDKPKHDVESLVGLLAIIIGGTVALGAGIQQSGIVNIWYIILYLFAGLIPLGGMLSFIYKSTCVLSTITEVPKDTTTEVPKGETSETTKGKTVNKIFHIYDDTTVSFAKYSFASSLLFIFICVWLVLTENFPGQYRYTRILKPSGDPKIISLEKGKITQFYISFPINKQVYEHGIPNNLTPTIRISGDINRDWEVYHSLIYDISEGNQKIGEFIPFPIPGKSGLYIDTLPGLATDGNYQLDIYLQGKNKEENTDKKEIIKDIKNEIYFKKNILVVDQPLPLRQ